MTPEKDKPKCFGNCGENPEWLLKKYGVKEGDCDKCPNHEGCLEAY